jgi:P-type Cu+ transporter
MSRLRTRSGLFSPWPRRCPDECPDLAAPDDPCRWHDLRICVARVERVLKAQPGVSGATVNLASETAQVTGTAPATLLVQALEDAGYPAQAETLMLDVEEMTCASCVARVERVLTAQPGVLAATVNLANGTAQVRMLPATGRAGALAQALGDAGYPAHPRDTGTPAPDTRAAEAEGLRRNLIVAAALTLPVFVLEMGGHLIPAFHHWLHGTFGTLPIWTLQFLLTTAVLAGPGRVFFRRGIPALLKAQPDMNSLVAIGTAAAWGFSTVATFAPAALPDGARAVYFEAAAVIVTLILLGRWLEARAKGRTGQAIRRLMALAPRTARVDRPGGPVELPIDQIAVGDVIHLRPGERVAVDGAVTEGESHIDESMITGEPMPVARRAGDPVTGGTVNGTGALRYRATHVGADTVLAQIIRMVEEAQGARLPIQDVVNRVTLWFVPAVLAVAVLTVAVWAAFGPAPALTHALVAGVAVLIIACPCAMGLAVPTSIMVGTGRAAELGVLFRRGAALQALQGVQIVALDKTGTVTAGHPELTDITVTTGTEDAALRLAAAVEGASEHPIARAVSARRHRARPRSCRRPRISPPVTGHGVRATVEGQTVLVGTARFLRDQGIDPAALEPTATAWAAQGRTPLYLAADGRALAALAVSDPVKPGSRAAIAALRAMGLRVVMMTGDAQGTAQAVAAEVGIDEVRAELLPDGKLAAIRALRADGAKLAFVGDGINDAPALAAADTGIAIGTGTDVAIASADVVLMRGDLGGVVNAIDLSRRTMGNIRQNLIWAFGYNAALIPVAAGVLYPSTGCSCRPCWRRGRWRCRRSLSSRTPCACAARGLRWKGPPHEHQGRLRPVGPARQDDPVLRGSGPDPPPARRQRLPQLPRKRRDEAGLSGPGAGLGLHDRGLSAALVPLRGQDPRQRRCEGDRAPPSGRDRRQDRATRIHARHAVASGGLLPRRRPARLPDPRRSGATRGMTRAANSFEGICQKSSKIFGAHPAERVAPIAAAPLGRAKA